MWPFLGGSDGKESACNARDLGLIPRLGRCPGGGHGNPLQYSTCLQNPCGQKSLVGYSPRGHKDLDTTEKLSTAQPHRMCVCMCVCVRARLTRAYSFVNLSPIEFRRRVCKLGSCHWLCPFHSCFFKPISL